MRVAHFWRVFSINVYTVSFVIVGSVMAFIVVTSMNGEGVTRASSFAACAEDFCGQVIVLLRVGWRRLHVYALYW